jgi:hypothetical protein
LQSNQTAKSTPPPIEHTIFFQIANGNSRQACSLQTPYATYHQALIYFRQNWPAIEKEARARLAENCLVDGKIRLFAETIAPA